MTERAATQKGTELIKSEDTQRSSVEILHFTSFLVALNFLHFKEKIPGFIQTKSVIFTFKSLSVFLREYPLEEV